MKYHPKSLHLVIAAVVCVGLFWLASNFETPIFVRVLLIVAIAFSIHKVNDLSNRETNCKAIKSALPMLDRMYSDQRFVGANAKAVETRRDWRSDWCMHISQLCITDSGKWFILEFEVLHGEPIARDIKIVATPHEAEVCAWLCTNYEAYQKYFGEPTIA